MAGVDRLDAESQRAGLALLEQSHAAFEEAIRTLTEAVDRYPRRPQTVEALYRIAEAHRHSAKLPRKRSGERHDRDLQGGLDAADGGSASGGDRRLQQPDHATERPARRASPARPKRPFCGTATSAGPMRCLTCTLRRGDSGLFGGDQPLSARSGIARGICADRQLPPADGADERGPRHARAGPRRAAANSPRRRFCADHAAGAAGLGPFARLAANAVTRRSDPPTHDRQRRTTPSSSPR